MRSEEQGVHRTHTSGAHAVKQWTDSLVLSAGVGWLAGCSQSSTARSGTINPLEACHGWWRALHQLPVLLPQSLVTLARKLQHGLQPGRLAGLDSRLLRLAAGQLAVCSIDRCCRQR